MRALVQRVTQARVEVEGALIGQTGPGLLILVCAMQGDTEAQAEALAAKIAKLRIFKDEAGKMNRALLDTAAARWWSASSRWPPTRGRATAPAFPPPPPPACGRGSTCISPATLAAFGPKVETGQFGADMAVSLTNDGPDYNLA
jgi:D-aminoacyl-tRNA deacylase